MKLKIHAEKKRINLWLPLSFVRTKLFHKILADGFRRSMEEEEEGLSQKTEQLPTEVDEVGAPAIDEDGDTTEHRFNITWDGDVSLQTLRYIHKTLKRMIKENGHFNLVEVDASDGTKVLIRI